MTYETTKPALMLLERRNHSTDTVGVVRQPIGLIGF